MSIDDEAPRNATAFVCSRCRISDTFSGTNPLVVRLKAEHAGWMTWPAVLCPRCHKLGDT